MRIRQVIVLLLSFISLSSFAQTDKGIKMTKGSWSEIVEKAKQENKPIFVDVFTEWCGPCLNMAKTVFKEEKVGSFYNEKFVCTQIDAEKGEGKDLAKKYQVRVFPTYLFIDPNTQELLHRSTSVQPADDFLQTALGALDPHKSSFYFDAEYERGNRDKEFLLDYINFQTIAYDRTKVLTAFDQLVNSTDKGLLDTQVWEVFYNHITGNTPYLRQISDRYSEFVECFGKEIVDEKLAKETAYLNVEELSNMCDFDGKDLNIRVNTLEALSRQEKYDELAKLIDDDIANSSYATDQKYLQRLLYFVRSSKYYYDKIPESWFNKCVGYSRFLAYNWPDRDQADIHQLYASMLEIVIQRTSQPSALEKSLIETPKYGKDVYDMRDPSLKPKPKRN